MSWYADNHPYQIQANGATETFSYSPDGNRYLRVDTTPQGTTVTTVYIDGLLEVRYDSGSSETVYRNYIEAGGEPVAADTFTVGGTPSPAETVSYCYRDEIGSVEVTSDGSGGSLARYAYSAWGQARLARGIVSPAERAVRISASLGAVQLTPATDPVADSRKAPGNRCC
ncbi:MAG: hypothetical protein ACYDB9_13330 [Gammaproteobacteria bacterium]